MDLFEVESLSLPHLMLDDDLVDSRGTQVEDLEHLVDSDKEEKEVSEEVESEMHLEDLPRKSFEMDPFEVENSYQHLRGVLRPEVSVETGEDQHRLKEGLMKKDHGLVKVLFPLPLDLEVVLSELPEVMLLVSHAPLLSQCNRTNELDSIQPPVSMVPLNPNDNVFNSPLVPLPPLPEPALPQALLPPPVHLPSELPSLSMELSENDWPKRSTQRIERLFRRSLRKRRRREKENQSLLLLRRRKVPALLLLLPSELPSLSMLVVKRRKSRRSSPRSTRRPSTSRYRKSTHPLSLLLPPFLLLPQLPIQLLLKPL